MDKASVIRFRDLLAAGDPCGEVFEAWAGKEAVRRTYGLESEDAEVWFDETIVAAKTSPVAEVRRLGRTLKRSPTEILAFHTTRLSNGSVEGLNSIIKKLKRIAAGFTSFENYRCRIFLPAETSTGNSSTPPICEETQMLPGGNPVLHRWGGLSRSQLTFPHANKIRHR